jgi:hypothetical protein
VPWRFETASGCRGAHRSRETWPYASLGRLFKGREHILVELEERLR